MTDKRDNNKVIRVLKEEVHILKRKVGELERGKVEKPNRIMEEEEEYDVDYPVVPAADEGHVSEIKVNTVPIFCAHDSEEGNDNIYLQYTKTMSDYLFSIPQFEKFNRVVSWYKPKIFQDYPGARFEVLLYFIKAGGGRHVIPSNEKLFNELRRRSKHVYVIACWNKKRFGSVEDTGKDFLEGVPCLHFLMQNCEIDEENEHNHKVLEKIFRRLPEPPPPPKKKKKGKRKKKDEKENEESVNVGIRIKRAWNAFWGK